MRCAILFACFCSLACVVTVGCHRTPQQPPQANKLPDPAESKLTIGEPIQVKNLTIFPVLSSDARDEDRFITLDEGTRAGTVTVFEMGAARDPFAENDHVASTAETGNDALEEDAPQEMPTEQSAAEQSAANAPAVEGPAAADDPFSPATEPATARVAQADAEALPNEHSDPADSDSSAADADDALPVADVDDPFNPSGSPATNPATACPDVNRVVVVNKSGKSLYLMPGETIVGGQQDRVLAEEQIIPSGGKPVPVAVFCVEHGRWNTREATVTNSLAAVHPVGDLVVPTQFAPGKSSLHKKGRIAVQEAKNQNSVWDEVAKANADADNDTDTGAFTSNFGDAKVGGELQAYIDGLETSVAKRERIVGVVVAINGKVESLDVFESTPLFRKLWPKLIQGHALDAANAANDEAGQVNQPCLMADAQRFYDEATSGEIATTTRATGGLVLTGRASQGVISFSVNDGETRGAPASMGGGGMGGMGGMMGGMGGVHTSGFSK